MKKARLSCLYCWFLLLSITPLSAQRLSEQSQVSLLTYAPGQELYAAFGHSAIRITDPTQPLDKVYNYGMFSFHEPGFYLKFAAGRLNYWLGAYDFQYLEQEQRLRDMTVREQVLHLSAEEKQRLFDFLNQNLQPENRFYLYDFFFDNCATRIRDAAQTTLGPSLQLDTVFVVKHQTFRELIHAYLASHPWAAVGIDLALGAPIDRVMLPKEYLFLPDYLAAAFQQGSLERDQKKWPLVSENKILFQGKSTVATTPAYGQPLWIFYGLVIVFLLWTFATRRRKMIYWPDIILLSIYGIMGLVLFLLWFATNHQATQDNYNLLWLHPLHLLSVYLLAQKHKGLFTKIYFLAHGFLYLGLLAFWEVIPQALNPACLPLIVLLGFRYFYLYTTIHPFEVEALAGPTETQTFSNEKVPGSPY